MVIIVLNNGEEEHSYRCMDENVLKFLKAHKDGNCQIESINLNGYVITDVDSLVKDLIFLQYA